MQRDEHIKREGGGGYDPDKKEIKEIQPKVQLVERQKASNKRKNNKSSVDNKKTISIKKNKTIS